MRPKNNSVQSLYRPAASHSAVASLCIMCEAACLRGGTKRQTPLQSLTIHDKEAIALQN